MVEADPGLISQYHNAILICIAGGNEQVLVWGISLDVLSDIQPLIYVFRACIQRHGV